jgi:hypothetical protein
MQWRSGNKFKVQPLGCCLAFGEYHLRERVGQTLISWIQFATPPTRSRRWY